MGRRHENQRYGGMEDWAGDGRGRDGHRGPSSYDSQFPWASNPLPYPSPTAAPAGAAQWDSRTKTMVEAVQIGTYNYDFHAIRTMFPDHAVQTWSEIFCGCCSRPVAEPTVSGASLISQLNIGASIYEANLPVVRPSDVLGNMKPTSGTKGGCCGSGCCGEEREEDKHRTVVQDHPKQSQECCATCGEFKVQIPTC